jgi:bifunctional DNase/RNase
MADEASFRRARQVLAALLVLMAALGGWLLYQEAQAPARPAPDEATLSPTAHEMVVADMVRPRGGRGVVLVLQERGRGRYLLLTIGEAEAVAIASQLDSATPPPRPLTHDLLARSLGEVGAEVVRVVVTDVRENTYYARVVLRANGREVDLDSRPSDAVALALRTQAPIYCEAAVLERAAMTTEEVF